MVRREKLKTLLADWSSYFTYKHDGARCSRAYVENISNYYITGVYAIHATHWPQRDLDDRSRWLG